MHTTPLFRSLRLLLGLALCGILLVLPASAQAPMHVYLTWQGDTGTTMTVNFHTPRATESSMVLYDTEPRAGNAAAYRFRAAGSGHQIPGVAGGRYIHWVELSGLTPGETYYFVAGDSLSGFTEERKLRTIPEGDAPLRFVTGGDMGVGEEVRTLLRHAATWEPQFALIGGDIAYVNGDVRRVATWDAWLDLWEDEMVTPEGYTVPLVLAVGNHEVQGGYHGGPERAPFYFGLFAQNGRTPYFRRQFGQLVAVYVLDSGHVLPHAGAQTAWLEEQLRADQDMPYRFALYHVPLYPSHRLYEGTYSAEGRAHWAPLFDQYRLTTAFENHDHTFKRSHSIRHGAAAPEGVLYLGDGAWGRAPREIDLTPRWYLAKAGAQQHVWVVDVSPGEVVYRAFDIQGRIFDVYPPDAEGAAEAAAYFATLPQRYAFDKRTVTLDPLTADTSSFREDSIVVHVHNYEGYPAEAELSFSVQPPLRVVPEDRRVALKPGERVSVRFALTASPSVALNDFPGTFMDARIRYATPRGEALQEQRYRVAVEAAFEAPRAPATVRLDGRLDEWGSLPYTFDRPAGMLLPEDHFTAQISPWDGPSDASIRFAVAHDSDSLYVVLDVTDDHLQVDPGVRPWDDEEEIIPHDAVAVWVDPYPGGEGDDDPLFIVSPGTAAGQVWVAAADDDDEDLPEGLRVAGTTTPAGYVIEAALPLARFHDGDTAAKQVRLNLAISDKDRSDQAPRYFFWRPAWGSDDDFIWSGVFTLVGDQAAAPPGAP